MPMSISSQGSRRVTTGIALLAASMLLAALWLTGAFAALGFWALEQQRALQGELARTIQSVRTGQGAAVWTLIALSAAYGFIHAVGPGHGKVLVAGAAFGTTASAARMSLIALAGSLAQAFVAILLVYGGLALFQATSRQVVGLDAALEPVGHLAVASIGAWLVVRGLRSRGHAAGHCGCGHEHAPGPSAATASPREGIALVAAIAVRPCAGALIVLVLAWSMDLAAVGAGAVVAMGIGTAAFTAFVAALAVFGRDATLVTAGSALGTARVGAAVQVAAGICILLLSGALLYASAGA